MNPDLPNEFQFDLTDPVLSIQNFEELFSLMEIVPLCDDLIRDKTFVVNLQSLSFIDPYSFICLALAGRYLKTYFGEVVYKLPESFDMLTYFARTCFFDIVRTDVRLLSIHPLPETIPHDDAVTNLLLPLSPVEKREDMGGILQRLSDHTIGKPTAQFYKRGSGKSSVRNIATIVEAVGRNIVIHSGDRGYVMVQRYRDRLRHPFVIIGAGDLGVGIRERLDQNSFHAKGNALENIKNLFSPHNVSDKKKQKGLIQIKEIVDTSNGRFTIRSGGIRLDYRNRRYLGKPVCYFPGTQISVRI